MTGAGANFPNFSNFLRPSCQGPGPIECGFSRSGRLFLPYPGGMAGANLDLRARLAALGYGAGVSLVSLLGLALTLLIQLLTGLQVNRNRLVGLYPKYKRRRILNVPYQSACSTPVINRAPRP